MELKGTRYKKHQEREDPSSKWQRFYTDQGADRVQLHSSNLLIYHTTELSTVGRLIIPELSGTGGC